ncbi:neutral ceramidase isoform X2 [Diabrotica virgifera virgifera]|uniref:Neutral ceramidase n=1 Tax=Diabrotica virgifera virgifera TaxID=50390 RepID=A0ABM5KP42_DIAVI|nr:neutral ceramidase isoform X2 [Diabrotica virgifera virgifera]
MNALHIIVSFYTLFITYRTVEAVYNVGVGRADCTGPIADVTLMGYGDPFQLGCGLHLRQFARAFIFDDSVSRVLFVTVDAGMVNHPVKQAAVQRAHDNIVESRIIINSKELLETSINRSPASYLLNPKEERTRYKYNVDKDMVQLKFVRKSDNVVFGALNWFAVHGTSMNNTNCLVSSDNVGYASLLLELDSNKGFTAGKGPFVGAFASTNLGDVSPNTKGAICILTGKPCDYIHSTCGGNTKYCIASGPGKDMTESTEIIATNLFHKGKELLEDQNGIELNGDIKYIHKFVYMPNQTTTVQLKDGLLVEAKGCLPALGYSFAAGTTDGPGLYPFRQGTKNDNPLWTFLRNKIAAPTQEDKDCHYPKPILLMTGRMKWPYEWHPSVVSTQIFKIGQLILAGVPGEFTTMAGRRLREAIYQEAIQNGADKDTKVVIAGLSNFYTHYVTTREEYQLQRYEGASTLFGPNTLAIYIKIFREMTAAILKGETVNDEGMPYKFPKTLFSLLPPVMLDSPGTGDFGECIVQPKPLYHIGDTVSTVFISGHPRNSNLQEDTFLTVEKKDKNSWKTIATDASWETKFIWKRASLPGESRATVRWEINNNVEPGTYRITQHGYYKPGMFTTIRPYFGSSDSFNVTT